MKAIHISKRFILVILSTILLTLLCAPIYSHHLLSGLYMSHTNDKARIDIINKGKAQNRIEIIKVTAPAEYTESYPHNCKKSNGQCAIVNVTTAGKWQQYKIKFKAIGEGNLKILLRGPNVRDDNNERYPVLVDYRFAKIKSNNILEKQKVIWCDSPLIYTIKAKNKEVFELNFEARTHHTRWSDLVLVYNMNWLLFLSVLILAFLFSYKLIQYISKFKLLEHNSRIDIVFVVAFVLLLFLPMSRISTADKSMQENRMLATYPAIFEQTLNLNYGKQFENWFNDRFFGRNFLLKLYSLSKLYINNKYENGGAFLIKDSNWMFRNKDINFAKPKDNITTEIIKQISLLNDFCQDNNIKFYIMIVPSKESVYQEMLPDYHQNIIKTNAYNSYLEEIAVKSNVPVVLPYNDLREASARGYTYFKQGNHWTDLGAYIGYRDLMNVIKKDFPNIHITELDEYNKSESKLIREHWTRKFEYGGTTDLLAIDKTYAEKNLLLDNYTYYDNKNKIEPKMIVKDYYNAKYFNNKMSFNAPKVFLVGSSMIENLLQFLPYSFSETLSYRLNGVKKISGQDTYKLLKRYRKDILDYKPDIMILCITFKNVPQLVNLTKD